MEVSLSDCGVCGNDDELDDDGTDWMECEKCGQWFHCTCAHVDLEEDEEASFYFECAKCLANKKNNK